MSQVQFADPAALRRAAANLKNRAETLAYQAQRLDRAVADMGFEGYAANRFRSRMFDRRRTALHMAGELQDLANTLIRSAAQIEDQIASMGMGT